MWCDELLSKQPMRRVGNNLLYSDDGSAEWQKLQDGAEERYELEGYNSPTDLQVSALFAGFIATGLKPDAVVLDVGCGPFGELQPYAAPLGMPHYLGLEPIPATPERKYPCLVGVLAERIPLKDASVDAAVFATSLDHIEDEDAAMREIRRVLKPDGRVLIWQGRYDPAAIAQQKDWARTMSSGLFSIPRAAAEAGVTWLRMRKRKRQLANGDRIDTAHARYYTPEMIDRSIERWGFKKYRSITVPGSTGLFVELRHP